MKIIDNKKDYYDYLSGIWGIDDKVVFDRRGSKMVEKDVRDIKKSPEEWGWYFVGEVYLKIGDWVYGFVRDSESGEIVKMDKIISGWWKDRVEMDNPVEIEKFHFKKDMPDSVVGMLYRIYSGDGKSTMIKGRYGLGYHGEIKISNPILGQFDFIKKYIPAEEVWQKLYDYISKRNEKEIVDQRNDIEKLESAGFDKKTSFRKM